MLRKKSLFAWALVCAFAMPAHAVDTKAEQLIALEAILAELKTHYGMARFKEANFGVTYDGLRAKYSALVNEAMTLEEHLGWTPRVAREVLPADEFRQLMIGLVAELRDGHTNVGRQSRRRWTTGINAAAIEGRLYVVSFDDEFFTKGRAYPEPKIGDEIVAIDGVPVQELAKQQMIYVQSATYRTRYHSALELLVNPTHRRCRAKQTGAPVQLTFERPEGKKGDAVKKTQRFDGNYFWIARHDFDDLKRFRQFVDDKPTEPEPDRPYHFGEWGTYSSFFQQGLEKLSLPAGSIIELGQLVNAQIAEKRAKKGKKEEKAEEPQNPDEDEAKSKDLFPNQRIHVQIVRYEGKQIGILRIPDYGPFSIAAEMQWLREVVKQLENATDVLIIDQLTNPGGYVWQFAELASIFGANKPMNLGSVDVRLSETFFATYEEIPAPDFNHEKSVNNQRLNFAHLTLHRQTMETLRRRYDAGERSSGPLAFGAAQTYLMPGQPGIVVPRDEAVYTKPVLLLNDERSASGGDFFPAALQANGRAVIFGETSEGLGGPVYRGQNSMPSSEMTMRCTYGMCHRADGLPIENVGVVPDIIRPTTADDLRGSFSAYAKDALKMAVRLASGEQLADLEAAELKAHEEAITKAPKSDEFDQVRAILTELRDTAATEADASNLANRYRDGLERLARVDLTKLAATHWKLLRLPIPLMLAKTDPILASLASADAVEERLGEMLTLERYADGTPLRPLVQALANAMPALRGARLNPCLRALATTPPPTP